ncbi:Rhamnolipids biosynthesis 3-oxoacyl-[acyl-carrier-protein] reductase [Sinobacterium norvegicum]|uniref:Rhamnolipids biosynthesis 3-oxoacyl-[acyl-carrier-protein] reductase n=1 Tax=Sinobacterium norvegicum TaxID=1641715 RepID=A0ABM9AGI9_9GAMM|nr:SDR family oxidoreductase [Sinobacterium norvegicum]CAH0992141.1 Rhamnolipids biosynthesis 3-oxoacyl-[acyl-carrier-protein] reductase [Sinobacterium norvegicum]
MSEHADFSLDHLFSLQGKVALITGGSRGIGRMMAQGLLQAGAKVYITARKADPCQQAAEELSQYGDCVAIPADVADSDSRMALCARLAADEQQLDILINNAGSAWGDDYETYPEQAFEKLMKINVTAVFALTRDLTPMLETAGSGSDPARVINIGSMDGLHIPTVHQKAGYAYTATKAAVHQLTRHLAVELGPRGIAVNAVAPGFFASKMTDQLFENHRQDMEANSLLKRVGQAEEMAGVAIYLCSRAGAYTHGAVIPVDGGTSINHQHVTA